MSKTKKSRNAFFEQWSKDYDELRNKSFLEKSKKNMALIVEQYKHDKHNLLEIGLGTGEGFEMISARFNFSYGMDVSEGMVRRAYFKGKMKNNLFVSDACSLPLQNDSFDFIICQDVVEHVPNQHQLILEIRRVLKDNGIAIITTPNPLWTPILYVAEKLKLKVEEGEHEFTFLSGLIKNSLRGRDCSIIIERPFMMFPIKSRLDKFIEPLANKKFFSKFGFSQMCIIKKNA
jgi:ubiquinone/menaquinone biosynthesis C-methylase UbiE